MALAGDTTTERAALGLIVAITDLSVESERALSRAALLAAQHRAPLRLVYFAGGGKSHYPDPQARLVQRCRALGRQHNIVIEPADNADATLKSVKAAAVGADLLVMHHSLCGKLDGLVKRSVIDQLLRASRCPVLVVKNPFQQPYRRVLLPMNFTRVGSGQVKVKSILGKHFAQVPGTANADAVTLLEEEKIMAYYGAGTLYATPERQEPLI